MPQLNEYVICAVKNAGTNMSKSKIKDVSELHNMLQYFVENEKVTETHVVLDTHEIYYELNRLLLIKRKYDSLVEQGIIE